MKCSNCGGNMVPARNGMLKCRFCGSTVKDPSYKPEEAAPRPSAVPQTASPTGFAGGQGGSFVYEKNINGILEIECRFPTSACAGSGFLIAPGYAITNTHVVTHNAQPCNNITVRIAGEVISASIVCLGDDRGGHGNGVDLALLRLSRTPAAAKIVSLADFSSVKVGESVFVIGNSLGHGTCITGGIVSDRCRQVDGHMLLMTDCAVNGGNSGGPIFNAAGNAIGAIVSGITAAEGMNFAIPANVVIEFIRRNNVPYNLVK